jgi:hypothetical protein
LSREFVFVHIDPAGDGTDLGKDLFWIMLRLSFICFCQIDVLPRAVVLGMLEAGINLAIVSAF